MEVCNYPNTSRKEVLILSKPCICIDVSKDTSHVQGFIDSPQNPTSKPICINHTKTGFSKINDLYNNIYIKTNQKPLIILEYTGVYHKTVVSFLEEMNYDYFLISPLKSAKARNKEIRNAKTDKRDCKNLACMFYTDSLGAFVKQDKLYLDLKDLNSEYSTNKIHLQKYEVTLNELIDTIYPGLKNNFSDLTAKSTLNFLKAFPHPDFVRKTSIDELANYFATSKVKHRDIYSKNKATEIKEYVDNIISGCNVSSYKVLSLLNTIAQLELLISIQDKVLDTMINLAKQTPYFACIRSIPGVGDNSCARLIAGLGDISRFKKSEQINAFVGIDPTILQSGKMSGEHLAISKKGHKVTRSVLFLMVRSMIRNMVQDNPIKLYYKKKKAQPNVAPKVALFACVNKLIRIIYSLCKTGEFYSFSITQNNK